MQPNISYIICFTPRCGSTLLCEALTSTEVAGRPEEYFGVEDEYIWKKRWDVSTFTEYLDAVVKQGTTPNGICGLKVMWTQFDDLVKKIRRLPTYTGLSAASSIEAAFPNLHYIWIRRYDKVRQAISFIKARQTNIWAITSDSPSLPIAKPRFSFIKIDFALCELRMYEAAWARYFKQYNIEPFVVLYEDLVSNYEKTALQILEELGVPIEQVAFGPRHLKQQADEESEQWVKYYCYLKKYNILCFLISCINKYLIFYLMPIIIKVYDLKYKKQIQKENNII